MSAGTNKQRATDYLLPIGNRIAVLLRGGDNIVGDLDDAVFDDNHNIVALLMRRGQPASAPTYVAWHAVLTIDVVEDSINRDPEP